MEPNYLHRVAKTHIESYNYVINKGVYNCCTDIEPVWTDTISPVKIFITDAKLAQLHHPMELRKQKRNIYPSEVRMRKSTYYAEFKLKLKFESSVDSTYSERTFFVPLMVKSNLCYLDGMHNFALTSHKEDANDPGGYFIINGVERIVRQFFVPKRNYISGYWGSGEPIALIDCKFKNLKKGFTKHGMLIRSVKDNHTSKNVYLHYTEDNSVDIRVFYKTSSYYLPFMLVMKALVNNCDATIVEQILKFGQNDPLLKQCLVHMLRNLYNFYSGKTEKYTRICTCTEARIIIGNLFSSRIAAPLDSAEIAKYLLKKCLLIHLPSFKEKFDFLSFAICKLLSLVKNKFKAEDLMNPVFQEVLTSGQSYLIAVRDASECFLGSVKRSLTKEMIKNPDFNLKYIAEKCTNRAVSLSPNIKHMLSTGQIPGKSQGLPSNLGYTVHLLRLNIFATASQFAGIYKFSAEFYSNSIRKLYPESFGFLCPAQTPEGEHTGLYNYLASDCEVVNLTASRFQPDIIYKFGAISYEDPLTITNVKKTVIFVDGEIFAWIQCNQMNNFVKKLKFARSLQFNFIPTTTEIVYIRENDDILFPGLYILSAPCRLVRKVLNSYPDYKETFLGVLEQSCRDTSAMSGGMYCSYEEIDDFSFLSVSAQVIPFSENNGATRNIFSSVKSKQAISFPLTNLKFRSDTKLEELIYPQAPLVFTNIYKKYNLEENPIGTNVIIAVMSYTGYDMEDSIVLNKASIERGLMHDVIHKTIVFDFENLAEECGCNISELCFQLDPLDPTISKILDPHGLPYVGDFIYPNDPILSVRSLKNQKYIIKTFKEKKAAQIEQVRFMGVPISGGKKLPADSKKISITYCMKRIPEVGDKFSNNHGQKGICGFTMPDVDLPFSTSGIIPDLIFNPHGLPTRMSIGMMLEIMATKPVLVKGQKYCVQPFQFTDKDTAINEFGSFLEEVGFDYYGTEKFYSGTSGEELEADIFCGSAYYFRLHHIVEEKYQVESVNEIDPATRQPINRHTGAIRFGEMERDAILAHGANQLTLDRLLHNSDLCYASVCSSCETVLYPLLMSYNIRKSKGELEIIKELEKKFSDCRICKNSEFYRIRIPHVFYYLIIELSSIGIKVKLSKSAQEMSNDTDCIINDD